MQEDAPPGAGPDPAIQHKNVMPQLRGGSLYVQFVDHLLEVIGLDLTGHDFHHLLTDLSDLLVLSVGGLSDLVGALLGEAHAEQAEKIAIGGLHVDMGLNHCLMGKKNPISILKTAYTKRHSNIATVLFPVSEIGT